MDNPARGSGQRLSRFLTDLGVKQVVSRHLGDKLFGWLNREGIESFALTDPTQPIEKALRSVRERTLIRVSDANMDRLLHPAGQRRGGVCD